MFLKKLFAYLWPGVGEDEPIDPAPDDAQLDDPVDPEPENEPQSRGSRQFSELRSRARSAEEKAAQLESQLAQMRAQLNPQPQQPKNEVWEEEEKVLRDPNCEPWQRYAINAAREARAAKEAAHSNAIQTQDLLDQTDFRSIALEKPQLVEKYKEEVEKRLQQLRGQGRNAPRRTLLALVVGEDLLNGKLKPASQKQPTSTAGTRSARPRSDTQGKGALSEREARAQRLENLRI